MALPADRSDVHHCVRRHHHQRDRDLAANERCFGGDPRPDGLGADAELGGDGGGHTADRLAGGKARLAAFDGHIGAGF